MPAPVVAAAPPMAEPARLPIEFVPVSSTSKGGVPQIEVLFPIMGKQLSSAQAETYQIRLKAIPWSEGLNVVLLLDDFPPRVFSDPTKPIPMGELWPANRELEPGLHRLFALVQLPDGTTLDRAAGAARAPFAYLPFWVGPADETLEAAALREANGPAVLLVTPRGTFNGNAAADQVLLDTQVLGLPPDAGEPKVRAEVVVDHEAYHAEFGASEVRRIVGLPSGDHLVRVALLGADGQPSNARYATASRVITVNRDAPTE